MLFFFSLSAFEVRFLGEVTRYLLLDGTPTWVIIMPFMWIGCYLIIGGINSIARLLLQEPPFNFARRSSNN